MRDPLVDPQPNDVVESGGLELHVHSREPDQIYFGRWKGSLAGGVGRCNLAMWREECELHKAVVLQNGDEVVDERAREGK